MKLNDIQTLRTLLVVSAVISVFPSCKEKVNSTNSPLAKENVTLKDSQPQKEVERDCKVLISLCDRREYSELSSGVLSLTNKMEHLSSGELLLQSSERDVKELLTLRDYTAGLKIRNKRLNFVLNQNLGQESLDIEISAIRNLLSRILEIIQRDQKRN